MNQRRMAGFATRLLPDECWKLLDECGQNEGAPRWNEGAHVQKHELSLQHDQNTLRKTALVRRNLYVSVASWNLARPSMRPGDLALLMLISLRSCHLRSACPAPETPA